MIDVNGIRLRNRVVTSASLAGYGARPESRLFPYGLSPIAQFLPLERLGAVTTRTLTLEPREGHFTTRTDWQAREWPELLRRYAAALRRIDAGWLNAFGWCNIGIEAYLRDYFPRTASQNRIVSLGGFSAAEFRRLVRGEQRQWRRVRSRPTSAPHCSEPAHHHSLADRAQPAARPYRVGAARTSPQRGDQPFPVVHSGLAAPARIVVDGIVLRPTVAWKCIVGSNGRYIVSIR